MYTIQYMVMGEVTGCKGEWATREEAELALGRLFFAPGFSGVVVRR